MPNQHQRKKKAGVNKDQKDAGHESEGSPGKTGRQKRRAQKEVELFFNDFQDRLRMAA